eukprot:TRINITY_DN4483_c0_g4_i1.p1 TRINITY_DN4483_c0_g4~~TRINITY_DN4483_c0_g4_i1.p1  ORF type:complete len:265 (+),score=103.98 TRINITY_DN4483_c0_g4_i1:25-795(+)
MIRRPPRSTRKESSAASDVYKRQYQRRVHGKTMKKGVLIEVDLGNSHTSASPPVKARLENAAKHEKHIKLQDVMAKLEQAAQNREKLQKKRGEKLRTIMKKSKEKIMRRHSCAEVEVKKQREKVFDDLKGAAQRRRERINSMVDKLRAENEKVAEVHQQVKVNKQNSKKELKKKLDERLENTESQRKKLMDEMVKKLEEYNSEVSKRAKEHKSKKQQSPQQTAKLPPNECQANLSAKDAASKQKCMSHEHAEVEKK